ncbi:hypothetical protein [Neobacillus massiliamazoniensis]|uniref:Uncharacterized protein n=1 Tax=Neobacillus massiliamazoniensis TaxID=1499688 RepID=A0A0U1P4R0_9BACI|nr:hypothetical protein [Neobacillus massiliamazoniensis]CRK85227.1 hypothetical protein BN000_05299 [Neobacillus massiliamazoniensis]
MDSFKIGTWFSYKKLKWETNLEWCSEEVIRKTGLSRERLKKVCLKFCTKIKLSIRQTKSMLMAVAPNITVLTKMTLTGNV